MVVGDPSVLAIESCIAQPYKGLGQRALGFFLIHVGGRTYGVRSPDATLLACSLDAVRRRLSRRGEHCVLFGSEPEAGEVVEAVLAAMYDENCERRSFFGLSASVLHDFLISNDIVWAPDGDAAFDDGGHVLQFDCGNEVRLIAFKNVGNREDVASTIAEAWMSADVFYGLLDSWQGRFEVEWAAAVKQATMH